MTTASGGRFWMEMGPPFFSLKDIDQFFHSLVHIIYIMVSNLKGRKYPKFVGYDYCNELMLTGVPAIVAHVSCILFIISTSRVWLPRCPLT